MGLLTSLRVRMEGVALCLGDIARQCGTVFVGFHGRLQVDAGPVFGGPRWLALSLNGPGPAECSTWETYRCGGQPGVEPRPAWLHSDHPELTGLLNDCAATQGVALHG